MNICIFGMNNKIDKMNQKIEQLDGEKNKNITAHRTKENENEIILQENTQILKLILKKKKNLIISITFKKNVKKFLLIY